MNHAYKRAVSLCLLVRIMKRTHIGRINDLEVITSRTMDEVTHHGTHDSPRHMNSAYSLAGKKSIDSLL